MVGGLALGGSALTWWLTSNAGTTGELARPYQAGLRGINFALGAQHCIQQPRCATLRGQLIAPEAYTWFAQRDLSDAYQGMEIERLHFLEQEVALFERGVTHKELAQVDNTIYLSSLDLHVDEHHMDTQAAQTLLHQAMEKAWKRYDIVLMAKSPHTWAERATSASLALLMEQRPFVWGRQGYACRVGLGSVAVEDYRTDMPIVAGIENLRLRLIQTALEAIETLQNNRAFEAQAMADFVENFLDGAEAASLWRRVMGDNAVGEGFEAHRAITNITELHDTPWVYRKGGSFGGRVLALAPRREWIELLRWFILNQRTHLVDVGGGDAVLAYAQDPMSEANRERAAWNFGVLARNSAWARNIAALRRAYPHHKQAILVDEHHVHDLNARLYALHLVRG